MNILVIPSWYSTGYKPASGSFFREQALAVAERGHTVSVLYFHHYRAVQLFKHRKMLLGWEINRSKKINEYIFHFPKMPKCSVLNRWIERIIIKRIISERVERINPNIIHLQSFRAGSIALFIKRKLSIPFITTEHSSFFIREKFSKSELSMANRVFSESEHNFAVSEKLKNYLTKEFDTGFEYLPNFIDSNYFSIKHQPLDNIYVFLNIGFLKPLKKQDMLIRSFSSAFREIDNVRLHIAGNGNEYDTLLRLVSELDMEDKVVLSGYRNRDEIKSLLSQSNALVISSEYETFGVVAIEALAAGLPVVSTRCGGPESIVTEESVGILCDQDEASLAQGMLQCYHRDYDHQYIKDFAYKRFSSETVASRVISIYRECRI